MTLSEMQWPLLPFGVGSRVCATRVVFAGVAINGPSGSPDGSSIIQVRIVGKRDSAFDNPCEIGRNSALQ